MATSSLVAVAFMSHGQWVALCPLCMSGELFGRCDDGTTGGLTGDGFHCRTEGWRPDGQTVTYRGCGLRCEVEWPGNIRDLERVLLARPAPVTRNWQPGETLEDLIAENFAHGLVPTAVLEGRRFDVVDDQVAAGALDFVSHRELGG